MTGRITILKIPYSDESGHEFVAIRPNVDGRMLLENAVLLSPAAVAAQDELEGAFDRLEEDDAPVEEPAESQSAGTASD